MSSWMFPCFRRLLFQVDFHSTKPGGCLCTKGKGQHHVSPLLAASLQHAHEQQLVFHVTFIDLLLLSVFQKVGMLDGCDWVHEEHYVAVMML